MVRREIDVVSLVQQQREQPVDETGRQPIADPHRHVILGSLLVEPIVNLIDDQTHHLRAPVDQIRFQRVELMGLTQRTSIHHLIRVDAFVLPERLPQGFLLVRPVDGVVELSRFQAGEQRLTRHRRHGRQPCKRGSLVERETFRGGDQALADLHPLVEGQPVEYQQSHLGFPCGPPMPQEARHVVHHHRTFGHRLQDQVGVMLGCDPGSQTLV